MVFGYAVPDPVSGRVALAAVMRNSETPSSVCAADFQIVRIPRIIITITPAAVVVAVCCGRRGQYSDGGYSCRCAEQSWREKFYGFRKARFPHNLAILMSRTAPIYKTAIFLADY